MRVSEILKRDALSLSFEVFPPKTTSAFESVKAATEQIAALGPAFVSVTYGAGGGTSKYTLEIARNIRERYGVPTVAHLTCVSSSRELVRERIEDMKAAGIENVMALRGDLTPELAQGDRSGWAYHHAVELVRELKESGADFCIGGACYPEGHVECESPSADIRYLKEKVDAGLDFLTTQMFFDNNMLYNFLYRIREAGIDVPVLPGIMPITNRKQVARSVALSGSTVPQRFRMMVDRFGDDPAKMKQAGVIYATEQIIDLISNGVTHIHVYSMNKPDIAAGIMQSLDAIWDH